jgi:hypothetical protein
MKSNDELGNPMIKVLQDDLTKLKEAEAHDIGNNLAIPIIRSMYPSRSRGEMKAEFVKCYNAGHEAATAFWLPLIEKAVEMAEVYALENDPDFVDRCLDEAIEMRNKNPHSKEVFGNAIIGKKAREFLTTLADASGDK